MESIQISIYSHRPEVHDAITLVPGSLKRSLDAIRFLKSQGLKVIIANVLMTQNMQDYPGVRALAVELGVECTLDPTVTPMMDGDRSTLEPGRRPEALRQVFRDPSLVGDVDEFCAIARPAGRGRTGQSLPCSAGHTACYVSPYGDVYPCVQFPLPTGNVRTAAIRRHLAAFRSDERSALDPGEGSDHLLVSAPTFRTARAVPGLAFMEGNMRGPSSQDCEKSFARTGSSFGQHARQKSAGAINPESTGSNLVQIRTLPTRWRRRDRRD